MAKASLALLLSIAIAISLPIIVLTLAIAYPFIVIYLSSKIAKKITKQSYQFFNSSNEETDKHHVSKSITFFNPTIGASLHTYEVIKHSQNHKISQVKNNKTRHVDEDIDAKLHQPKYLLLRYFLTTVNIPFIGLGLPIMGAIFLIVLTIVGPFYIADKLIDDYIMPKYQDDGHDELKNELKPEPEPEEQLFKIPKDSIHPDLTHGENIPDWAKKYYDDTFVRTTNYTKDSTSEQTNLDISP